jgi:aryl sulfotransferase
MRPREPSKTYFTYQLDSRLWDLVQLRPRDVIVASAPKVGSTWTLRIIATLIHGEALPAPLATLSPWVDRRFSVGAPRDMVERLDAQAHRRSMRSHLPFDALPYDPEVRYICVARDPRDVALSLNNHYAAFTDEAVAALNAPPGTFDVRFERATSDIHAFIHDWLTRPNPNLPWETEGFPSWSLFRQVRSFWDFRELPNVLLVHYDDLKTDLAGEAARIARFIGVEPSHDRIAAVERCCTFEAMREDGAQQNPGLSALLKGGAATFYNKGVSGGWEEVFTPSELSLYDAAARRNLTPDAARWLERGRLASNVEP